MANVRDTRGYGGRTSSQNPVVEEFVPSSHWREDPRTHSLVVDLPGFKKDELKLQVTGSGDLMISGERKEHEEKIVYFGQTFKVPKNTEMDKTTGKFSGEILYVTVPKQVVEEKRTDENVEGNASGFQREDEKKSKGYANHLPQGKTGFKNDEVQFQITGSGNLMISGERKVHEDKVVYFDQTFTVPKNMDKDKTTGKFSGEILFVTIPKQMVEEKRNVGFSEEIIEYLKNTNSENVVEMLKRNKGIFMTAILAFSLGLLVTRKSKSTGN